MGVSKPPRPSVVAAPKFVLRTPLLPRDELDHWGSELAVPTASPATLDAAIAADRELLRRRLCAIVLRPYVREAIFVASPSLHAGIDTWMTTPRSEAGRLTERSLVRYVSRMASRPTPFGLFAGNTAGTIGETTQLRLADRKTYRRYTRLDGDYLAHVTDMLGTDPMIRAELRYRPNSSLCMVAGRMRYAMRAEGASRSYSLISLEPSDYLVATLEAAKPGTLPGTLAQALADGDPDVSREEADNFIAELISTQVLVSELAPPVTGPEAIDDVVEQLLQLSSSLAVRTRTVLGRVSRDLRLLDAHVGNDATAYRAIAEVLAPLPVKLDIGRLFQVNLVPKGNAVTLGRDVIDEIIRAVEILRRVARPLGINELARFRDAFLERYELREVPLIEVLDEESGIGFAMSNAPGAQASPLLEGLPFPSTIDEELTGWSFAATHLLRRTSAAIAAGHDELVLDDRDIDAMALDAVADVDSFGVLATLANAPDGGTELLLGAVLGPTGATILGRFCHSDPELHADVTAYLRIEEALQPDTIFAEIVHLADGRLANIAARPVLRDYEIVYLGRSGAPRERQIEVSDLTISVRNGRVILRSMRLGREICPRLTNAHNFSNRSLGTYRFLATLQRQHQRSLGISADALDALPYTPRIRHGRTVLRLAQWQLVGAELDPIVDSKDAARVTAVRALRTLRHLPRWICIHDGDNILPVDLDNILSIDSFAQLVRGKALTQISELWPLQPNLTVRGPDGGFANEVFVPFTRVARSPASPVPVPLGATNSLRRRFAPGSEWLYVKLYTGSATSDQVLEAIAPVVTEFPEWFFIRYSDPKWHVRVRVRGAPGWLLGEVAPKLAAAIRPLVDDDRIYRVQYDTYERELERYGGMRGIELAERWFHADSVAVIAILGMLSGDSGIDARWRLAVRGVDQLLTDLGFDLEGKLAVMRGARDSFATEHRVEKHVLFQRKLGERYRAERTALEAVVDPSFDANSEFAPALALFDQRSRASAQIFDELRAAERAGQLSIRGLAHSYVHMHANRILRSAHRAHELVIYDLLVRLYESRIARSKANRPKKSAREQSRR